MDERIALLDGPRSTGKALVGPLGGLWRYCVGDYRVICDIRDDTLVTLVVQVGNRREVYRSLNTGRIVAGRVATQHPAQS
jgi:mRNA interferase RelE/StbE